jgi:glycosyltransferase involved in cell wall biosynthesis
MTSTIVVPCFDEAPRFDAGAFAQLADVVDGVLLVDDGSTDSTPALLDSLAGSAPAGTIEVIRLSRNRGKAEAVRAGMQAAVAGGASIVGYFDADFATPVTELERLLAVITKDPQLEVVLASRVALMGHSIERKAMRHYLGRLYATAASLALGVVVYDTQCGAKLFRVNDTLRAAIADPFPDRWAFDVELLARLLHPAPGVAPIDADRIVEVPLNAWRDVGGSKLHMLPAARSLIALAGVRRRVTAREKVRRAASGGAAVADR